MRQFLGCLIVVTAAVGCQCCGITERYQDKIDHLAVREPHLERYYKPTWDVSRIGHPDWCHSSFNRWWCGKDCRAFQPTPHCGVYHNAIYPGMQVGRPSTAGTGIALPPAPTGTSSPAISIESSSSPSEVMPKSAPAVEPEPPAPMPHLSPVPEAPAEPAPLPERPASSPEVSPPKSVPSENLPVPPVPPVPSTPQSGLDASPSEHVSWATHELPTPVPKTTPADLSALWSAARKNPSPARPPVPSSKPTEANSASAWRPAQIVTPAANFDAVFPATNQWQSQRAAVPADDPSVPVWAR